MILTFYSQFIMSTSKKQLQDLVKENANLKLQVETLSSQMAELNENTVISSMNEMKERYDKMIASTVCINKYFNLKMYYTKYLNLAKTIENVNSIIHDDVLNLTHFLEVYKPNHSGFSEEIKSRRLTNDLMHISNRLLMITQLINKDDDEWSDNECDDYQE